MRCCFRGRWTCPLVSKTHRLVWKCVPMIPAVCPRLCCRDSAWAGVFARSAMSLALSASVIECVGIFCFFLLPAWRWALPEGNASNRDKKSWEEKIVREWLICRTTHNNASGLAERQTPEKNSGSHTRIIHTLGTKYVWSTFRIIMLLPWVSVKGK